VLLEGQLDVDELPLLVLEDSELSSAEGVDSPDDPPLPPPLHERMRKLK